MAIDLDAHQLTAIENLRSGSILCGGVGSGKSRTALFYYFVKDCGGAVKLNGKGSYSPMTRPRKLYIITTAKKRDSLEWQGECVSFILEDVVVDSWNNIGKYKDVKNAFFIFDEQRVIGSGAWVKAFLKIAKPKQQNHWLLLTATPADTWMDYIPVFVANGFYQTRTEFIRTHVVYNTFSKFPKIDHYVEVRKLEACRDKVLVPIEYYKHTVSHERDIQVSYDKEKFKQVMISRWNVFENKPIENATSWCYLMRKVCNTDPSRQLATLNIINQHNRVIIFYNFDYELELLRKMSEENGLIFSEWNGHKHELIPETDSWVYLVQYSAGAEGWECITTDTIIFFSQNYSYRMMTQAAGRIDRRNTPFKDLFYYHLRSKSFIDKAMKDCYDNKESFNETIFERKSGLADKTYVMIEEREYAS